MDGGKPKYKDHQQTKQRQIDKTQAGINQNRKAESGNKVVIYTQTNKQSKQTELIEVDSTNTQVIPFCPSCSHCLAGLVTRRPPKERQTLGRYHGGRRPSCDDSFHSPNRHSTIDTRQTQYHEALPSSANVQSNLTSSFAVDGKAS